MSYVEIKIEEFRKIIECADRLVIKQSLQGMYTAPQNFTEHQEIHKALADYDFEVGIRHYPGLNDDRIEHAFENGLALDEYSYSDLSSSFTENYHSNYQELQRRIQEVNKTGNPELNREALTILSKLPYPRYYLEFETVKLVVPNREHTGPFLTEVPCQWSCHIEHAPGQLTHKMFLDLEGDAPPGACLEGLTTVLGDTGPIFLHPQDFEKSRVSALNDHLFLGNFDCPEEPVIKRITDLLPLTAFSYYHPEMRGSWALKAVLPTIEPSMDYNRLMLRSDGDAQVAYRKILHPKTTSARKQELTQALHDYCTLGTLGIVRLAWFLQGFDVWTFLPSLVSHEAPENPDPLLRSAEESLRQYCLAANTMMVISPPIGFAAKTGNQFRPC